MAKNKNNAASAAEIAAKKIAAETNVGDTTQSTNKNQVAVITLGELDKLAQQRALAGMDPNHAEDLIGRLDDRFYKDPDAAKKYNIDQGTVDAINEITARGMVALLVNEVTLAQTPFAVRMRQSSLEQMKTAAAALGVVIDTKALPAPGEDGVVEVPSTAIKPSKETKKAVKEEQQAANAKVELDPTKVDSEEMLKKCLLQILVKGNGSTRFYDKVITAINFYEAYCKVNAEKQENREELLKNLAGKSRGDFLNEIATLLGRCTFSIGGMAGFMYDATKRSKSPVAAYATFRDATLNEKTGNPQIDEELIADITRTLVLWYIQSETIGLNEKIGNIEENIKVLSKEKKKNAAAINEQEAKILECKTQIEELKETGEYVTSPDTEFVTNFVNNYTDNKAEGFKAARMAGSKVLKTYYPKLKASEVNQDDLLHNLSQRIGIITNMFNSPMDRLPEYSESNLTEIREKEEEKEEKNS